MSVDITIKLAMSLWAVGIAWIDMRQRRIPNTWLVFMLAVAMTAQVSSDHGLLGVTWAQAMVGAVACLGASLPGYLARMLGAGDVKLLAVIGFMLGTPKVWGFLLVAAIVLGGTALVLLLARKRLRSSGWRSVRFPAAAPVVCGVLAVTWLPRLVESLL